MTRAAALALVVSPFSGCGGYAPLPLDDSRTDAVLSAPDPQRLAQRARELRHPRLPPIELDPSKPLSSDEIAVIAVLVNPDLKALRAREGVAEAQVFAAGLLPDPRLAAGISHPTTAQVGLVNAYNIGLSWDVLGLLTRRAARRVAQARQAQVRYDVAWNEWVTANNARLQAFRLGALEAQYDLAAQAADITGRLLETSRRNLERRDIRIDAFALREVAYLDARDAALALRRDLEKTRQAMNQSLGLPPSESVVIAAQKIAGETPRSAPELFDSARSQRLDLIALRAGYQAQEDRLQRDLLARFPQVSLGLDQARDTGDVTSIGFSVGVSLPIFNGGRGAVAIARATRKQLHAEYAARLFQTRSDIATLVADIERLDRQIKALSSNLPSLERAETVMRGAVASGDVTLLIYETVRANLLVKRLALLRLEQAKGEQQIALQLAAGEPLRVQTP